MECFICSLTKIIDDHHIDCQEGRLSPETVPLCRRCHRTYHDLGVEWFDDEYLDKAIEVENKRREIFNRRPECVNPFPLLTRADIKRSDYWYKKHHITPPSRLGRKKPSRGIPFRIPSNPLCGEDWLKTHLTDHTPEEIGALTIEIGYDNRWLPPISITSKRGTVKTITRNILKETNDLSVST